jgi:signal transduction histidine kinase
LLRAYSRDMREASQQVSFVNHVSHELKTPLTNIRMYAELLERDLNELIDSKTDRPHKRLKTILSECDRLSRLIGNVLTFGKQRRNALQLQYREVDLEDHIYQMVDRFRPSLDRLGMSVDLQMKLHGRRMLDPDALEQIVGNLVNNAEKYAAQGGRIGIHCSTEQDWLSILIVDDGPGIPPNQRDIIFQPFKRLKNDLSYAAGTGLGLTIARELARLHGGDVRLLESSHGCRFEVRLRCPSLDRMPT